MKHNNKTLFPIEQRRTWLIMLSGFCGIILTTSLLLTFFGKATNATINTSRDQSASPENSDNGARKNIKLSDYLPFEATENFTGRQQEKRQIDNMLKAHKVTVLHAFAGTGKTTFAVKYGHDREKSGTIVRWINADSFDKVITGYLQMARELGIIDYADNHYKDDNRKPVLIRKVLATIQSLKTPVLLIFDNVEKYDTIKETILNKPDNVEILITTRSQKLDDSLEPYNIRLEPFNHAEAVEYFKKALKNKNTSSSDINELVQKYSTQGGLLPLKLSQVTNIINTGNIPVKEYIRDIKKYDAGANVFLVGIDKHKNAWKILQYAAYLDPDFMPFVIFERLLGKKIPKRDTDYLKSQLLTEVTYYDNNTGFRVHRLVQDSLRNYIRQNHDNTLNQDQIVYKLLAGLDNLFPLVGKTPNKDWQEADMLLPHVLKVIKEYKGSDDKHLAGLYDKLGFYNLNITNQLNQALDYFTKAFKINKKLYSGNKAQIANSLNNLGLVYNILGQSKTALEYHKEALAIRNRIYNYPTIDIANSLNNLGLVYYDLGDLKEALECHKRALHIYQNLGDYENPDIANSYNKIGRLYRDLGNHEEALKYAGWALEIYQGLYDDRHPDVANSYNNIGRIYHVLGDHKKALDYTFKALKINQEIYKSPHPDNVLFLTNIGWTLNDLNEPRQGIKYCREALEVSKKLHNTDHTWVAYALKCVANSHYLLGNYDKSLKYSTEAMELDREHCDENHPYMSRAYYNMARAYYKLKDYPRAIEYYQKSINIRQKIFGYDNHPETAESFQAMAQVYYSLHDTAKSLELLGRAYIIYRNILGAANPNTEEVKAMIVKISPYFLQNVNTHSFIRVKAYGEDEDEVKIRKKIQTKFLNKIQKLAGEGKWQGTSTFFGEKGVADYLDEPYLKSMLGSIYSPKNVERARMLGFEAINLGIMHSKNMNYSCAEEYVKTYPQLAGKIKTEHWEYFVDDTIAQRFN